MQSITGRGRGGCRGRGCRGCRVIYTRGRVTAARLGPLSAGDVPRLDSRTAGPPPDNYPGIAGGGSLERDETAGGSAGGQDMVSRSLYGQTGHRSPLEGGLNDGQWVERGGQTISLQLRTTREHDHARRYDL